MGLSQGVLGRQQEMLGEPPCQEWHHCQTPREFGLSWIWDRWKIQLLTLGLQVRAGWILVWVIKQNLSVIVEIQGQIEVTFLCCLTSGLHFLHNPSWTNSEIPFMYFKPMVSFYILSLINIFVSHKCLQPLNAINQQSSMDSYFFCWNKNYAAIKHFPRCLRDRSDTQDTKLLPTFYHYCSLGNSSVCSINNYPLWF